MKIDTKLIKNELESILIKKAEEIYLDKELNKEKKFGEINTAVATVCEGILEYNPDNIYAKILHIMVVGKTVKDWEKDIGQLIKSAKEKLGESESLFAFCLDVLEFLHLNNDSLLSENKNVGDALIAKCRKLINDARATSNYAIAEENVARIQEISDMMDEAFYERKRITCKLCYDCISDIEHPENMDLSYFDAIRKHSSFYNAKKLTYNTNVSIKKTAEEEMAKVNAKCEELVGLRHQRLVAKYWEAHPEEKASIEADIVNCEKEIESLGFVKSEVIKKQNEDIAELNGIIDSIRAEQESKKSEILAQISALETEKASQGLFALKAKKQLGQQIEEKHQEFQSVVSQYDEKVYEQEGKIETVKKNSENEQKEIDKKIIAVRGKISQQKDVLANKEG